MGERRTLVKAFAREYRKAGKKERGSILDRFVRAAGYARRYAARLLRNHGREIVTQPEVRVVGWAGVRVARRGRRRYGEEVRKLLPCAAHCQYDLP